MSSLLVRVVLLACLFSATRAVWPDHGAGFESNLSSPTRGKRGTPVDGCGVRGPVYNALIAGGEDATFGEFPWHVGVYRFVVNKPHVQDCGGTLISRRVVITAAHCFWDESTKVLKPNTLYNIALGKYLRDWTQKEEGLQIRNVSEIVIPKRYRGRGSHFQYDIAVVKLASQVEFTATVKPICMDWTMQYEDTQLSTGNKGTVVGWGVTLNDTAGEVLQKVDLNFVDFDTCFNALPNDAKNLYTDDKFCAGFANKSRSVCRGDSGGGLVFSDARERYYLRGVVSVSFKPAANRDPCYSQLYTGFTLVSTYLPWIKTYVDAEESSSGSATPEPPKKKSKSEEMCEAYSSAVYDSVDLPSADPAIKVSTCAMSPGGVTTQRLLSQPREFPHVAAIGYASETGKTNWGCIGSLISERFVLTVAHCVRSPSAGPLKWVRLGSVKLYVNNTDQGLIQAEVEEAIVHPEYKRSSKYNDIALLKLKEAVSFNGYVRPACLDPSSSLLNQNTLTAASWGRTSADSDVYDGLLNGDVRVVDSATCRKAYANHSVRVLKDGISAEKMICAHPLDMSTDCALLSGSPFMMKLSMPFCMYRIIGIVSFGTVACVNLETHPTVGTRISAYTPWIESVVWPSKSQEIVFPG